MCNAVTGQKSEDVSVSVVPESMRDLVREAMRRASPKVVQALESPKEGVVVQIRARPGDS